MSIASPPIQTTPRASHRLARFSTLVLLLICMACGGEKSGGRTAGDRTTLQPIRLFTDRMGEIPGSRESTEEVLREFAFTEAGETLGWQAVGDATGLRADSGGIHVDIRGNVGGIELRGDFDPRAIDVIETTFRLEAERDNRLAFAWRYDGQFDLPISELINRQQYYKLHGLRRAKAEAETIDFPVGDLDKWSGDIRGILVLVRPKSRKASVQFERIRFRSVPLRDRVTASALGTDEILRVRLGAQSRPTLFAPPPADWVEAVDVPDNSRLELGYAILESAWRRHRYPVRFIAEVLDDESEAVASVTEVLDPANKLDHRRWMDFQIDLTDLAGQSVDIRLRTEAVTGPDDPKPDFDRDRLYALWGDPRIVPASWNQGGAKRSRTQSPPNVILISIDTLRADHLSSYGYPRPTSPTLDRLTREGTLFQATMSQAPETLPSHRSIMTGTYVGRHRSTTFFEANARTDLPTISRALDEAGYSSAAFTEGGGVSAHFGFNEGFQRYDNGIHRVYTARERSEVAFVEKTFGKGREWLEKNANRPFFLFLHTYETHAPYWPEAPLNRLYKPDYQGNFADAYSRLFLRELGGHKMLTERDVDQIIRLYDGCIRNVDREIAKLRALLDDLNVADNTLLVILSDHGEDLADHFYVAKHGVTLYEELVHVPMIFHYPGVIPAGQLHAGPAATIDVFPTILELLGLPIPDPVQGVSLVPALTSGEPLADRMVFAEDYTDVERIAMRDRSRSKVIYSHDIGHGLAQSDPQITRLSKESLKQLGKPVEAFDLFDDPAETRNLALGEDPPPYLREILEFRRSNQRGVLIELYGGSESTRITGQVDGIQPISAELIPWPDGDERIERKGTTTLFDFEVGAGERRTVSLEVLLSSAPFGIDLRVDGSPISAERVSVGADGKSPESVPMLLTIDSIQVAMEESLGRGNETSDQITCRIVSRYTSFDAKSAATIDRETFEQLEMLGYVPDRPVEKPKD